MNTEAVELLEQQSIEKTLRHFAGKYPELVRGVTDERLDQMRAHLEALVVQFHG